MDVHPPQNGSHTVDGHHQKPGFRRWCEMDFATIHSRCCNPWPCKHPPSPAKTKGKEKNTSSQLTLQTTPPPPQKWNAKTTGLTRLTRRLFALQKRHPTPRLARAAGSAPGAHRRAAAPGAAVQPRPRGSSAAAGLRRKACGFLEAGGQLEAGTEDAWVVFVPKWMF